jgi:predicted ATPase/DNA-binding winged helix-turn-helix (wHTH) protein
METVSEPPASVAFGRFRVLPHRRELLADGQLLKLGGRAYDVLMALIEGRGAVVTKDALMVRVWPGRIVEESAVQVQISALRAAFGPDRELIRTVSGRGYQFTGKIMVASANLDDEPSEAGPGSEAPSSPTNVPEPVSDLIGRDEELQEALGLAAEHRLVTLTGPGGIGKTRLALAVARRLLPQFADGIWVAELSPLTDPGLVAATVACAVGIELPAGEISPQRVAQTLADRRLLLVLDTCEHVITASAELAEAVLRAGSTVRIVATSREPLRAEGEQTYPVQPLAVPTEAAEDPCRYGAVQLFVARSRESGAQISKARNVARRIAAICQRLDGFPLAIELAASRAAVLGVEQLATLLDDRFSLLTGGRRTALPRHQTLRATLDWSYELLTLPERLILPRLAVFAGTFSLDAAGAVVGGAEIVLPDVVEYIFSLVAKSLVATVVEGETVRYRLLDTTRAYVLEKLTENGERERLARRHAEYYQNLLERAETESERRPAPESLDDYGRLIDNLRAALDWAVTPGGDAAIAVALTAAAVPIWMHLSLMEECRGHVERALATFDAGLIHDARREMKLHAARAVLLPYIGSDISEIGVASAKALQLAEMLGDFEYQLRSLWSQWYFHSASGRYRVALERAQRFSTIAANQADATDRLVGEILVGVSLHYLGDQTGARGHIGHALEHAPLQRSHIIRFLVDQRVFAGVYLSRILWLQGFPEQAMRTAERCIDDARAANHAVSLCNALALGACLIALLVGDLAKAERYIGILLDHSKKSALPVSRAYGRSYDGVLAIERGDLDSGLRLLRAGLDDFEGMTPSRRYPTRPAFPAQLARALAGVGRFADGLAAIDEVLAWTADTEADWFIAELLRVKGELLLLQGAPEAAATAEDHFLQALDWARRQGALSWELRATTSLARLLCNQGRPADALALLQPVYDQFTEGFDTADLKAAKALLNALC